MKLDRNLDRNVSGVAVCGGSLDTVTSRSYRFESVSVQSVGSGELGEGVAAGVGGEEFAEVLE